MHSALLLAYQQRTLGEEAAAGWPPRSQHGGSRQNIDAAVENGRARRGKQQLRTGGSKNSGNTGL